MSTPNTPKRPKPAAPGGDLIPDVERRRRLGGSFSQDTSLDEAREYDAVRPRYPAAVVSAIASLAAVGVRSKDYPSAAGSTHEGDDSDRTPRWEGQAPRMAGVRIAELGAGTGILTRELLAAGAEVHAVEPSGPMGAVLNETARAHERLTIHRTAAEDTGLAGHAVDVVVASQAWHWFDPDRIQAELLRILTPQGAVAVVGNYLDTSVDWVHRLTRIMRAGDIYRADWQPHLDPQHFTPVQTQTYTWSRRITPEEILRLAATMSSWLAAQDAEREKRRANLTWYLYEHLGHEPGQQLSVPYITAWHTARRRSATEHGLVSR